jgi:hypothetical protein
VRFSKHVRFLASLTCAVKVQQRQVGCVRFSYVPQDSRTPRRYRCQPDLALNDVADLSQQAIMQAQTQPLFTSQRYGDPGYAQLTASCPEAIRTGADDGAEMGAFHDLYQPQREANLRTRLDEYLRTGLEAGIFYAT